MKHDAARGEWSEGEARYLVIRNDSLMGLFQRLEEPARSAAAGAADCAFRAGLRP